MPIAFRCACGKDLQAPDEAAGKQVKCPQCGQIVAVPAATAIKPRPAAAPIQAEPPLDKPSRRRDDREYDDDDRPRRGRRSVTPSSSSKTVWIVLAAVFGSMCCGGAILTALLVPAVQKVREAAARTQTLNNLKQLSLAVHNFHDVHRRLPDPDENGLSWRVALLPFIESDNIFKAFKKDEPWDGPNNSKLLAVMPEPFKNLIRPDSPPGQTFFQFVTGPKTIFPGGPQTFRDIKDGPERTLMIVDATDSVPWSKPADIAYDPKGPLPRLGDPMRGGQFLAGFADASVVIIPPIDEATMRALLTADGGEPVDRNQIFGFGRGF